MLLEITPNEYINTKHVLLLKIIYHPNKPRTLTIEFINGVIVKYLEAPTISFEDVLNSIKNENLI